MAGRRHDAWRGADSEEIALAGRIVGAGALAGHYVGGRRGEAITGSEDSDRIFGRGGDDTLYGYGGNDLILGGRGDDSVFGGDGVDTISFKDALAGVTLDLTPGKLAQAHVGANEIDTLRDVENILGSRFGDTLTLRGNVGRLDAGGGDDRVYLDPATDVGARSQISLQGGSGYDILDLSLRTSTSPQNQAGALYLSTRIAGFEEVRGSGQDDFVFVTGAAVTVYGGAGNDNLLFSSSPDSAGSRLVGDDGDDYLGGGTRGTYDGGGGDDRISVGPAYSGDDDLAIVDGGNGVDWLYISDNLDGGLVRLGDGGKGNFITGVGNIGTIVGIENVATSGFDEHIIGNNAGNTIIANDGADIVEGGAGDDVLIGNRDFGTFGGYADSDVDLLTGGAGADRFVFDSIAYFTDRDIADRITDFSRSDGDLVDLASIDADQFRDGNQAFTFNGTKPFGSHPGEVRCESDDGHTTIQLDVNGDAVADLVIRLDQALSMIANDFVL